MLRKIVLPLQLFLLLALLAGCSGDNAIQDSYELATLPPEPTSTSAPTEIPTGADGVGATFYKAWETGDYIGMYSLLSPQSQALIDGPAFAQRYQEAIQVAAVQRVTTKPLSSRQLDDRVQMAVRVTWESGVLGEIVRDHEVELVFSGGRWG
ncbi:MAG: hypothetical protein KDE28_27810, partial [Anaerolineales bacterium]|nr:hypothetical protein [Anaerolineales bacterium]